MTLAGGQAEQDMKFHGPQWQVRAARTILIHGFPVQNIYVSYTCALRARPSRSCPLDAYMRYTYSRKASIIFYRPRAAMGPFSVFASIRRTMTLKLFLVVSFTASTALTRPLVSQS